MQRKWTEITHVKEGRSKKIKTLAVKYLYINTEVRTGKLGYNH